MRKTKAFVIMYNRLTWPKQMCEWLADNGCEVILVDNGSTYAPLLDWYGQCPYKVHRLKAQIEQAHKTPWTSGIIGQIPDSHYIVTDHDLDLSAVPSDFLAVLMAGLENKDAIKCGLSLRIDDLPDNELSKKVVKWEKKFWLQHDQNGYYLAPVDTTLALYDAKRTANVPDTEFFRAVRTPEPYTARHLPWYNTPENLTEEERFYLGSITNNGFWGHEYKRTFFK
jgi:hypothetical protein